MQSCLKKCQNLNQRLSLYIFVSHLGQQLLTYYLHPNVDSTTASALIAANVNGIARPVSPLTAAGMISAAGLSSTVNSSSISNSSCVSSSTAAAVSAAAAQLQQHYATVAASAGGKLSILT